MRERIPRGKEERRLEWGKVNERTVYSQMNERMVGGLKKRKWR